MNIDIRRCGHDGDRSLVPHVERSLYYALGRFAARILRISVQLRDLNGAKGGCDKHCQVRLAMRDGALLVVEKRAEAWLDAVHAAAATAARAAARRIARSAFSRRYNLP
jgi:hypothetical protein